MLINPFYIKENQRILFNFSNSYGVYHSQTRERSSTEGVQRSLPSHMNVTAFYVATAAACGLTAVVAKNRHCLHSPLHSDEGGEAFSIKSYTLVILPTSLILIFT